MPYNFPIDHVLNRSIRLLNEIRITRRLRDVQFVHVQILEIELEDLLARTQPYMIVKVSTTMNTTVSLDH